VYFLESLPRSSWNVLGRVAGRDCRMSCSMYSWSPMAFSDFVVWIILCDDCSFIAND
jgi:hypothetical protein